MDLEHRAVGQVAANLVEQVEDFSSKRDATGVITFFLSKLTRGKSHVFLET